ncbi:MAG: hypothetical protein NTY41_02020 [Proteobacteria bacterium]|nr:hypothetical protein [Pseudomonadota bacterium]
MTRKMNDTPDPGMNSPALSLMTEMHQLRESFAKLAQMRSDGLLPSTFRGKSAFEEATKILTDMADKMASLTQLSASGTDPLDNHLERPPLASLPNDSLRPWINQIERYASDLAVLMERYEQLEAERNTHA